MESSYQKQQYSVLSGAREDGQGQCRQGAGAPPGPGAREAAALSHGLAPFLRSLICEMALPIPDS